MVRSAILSAALAAFLTLNPVLAQQQREWTVLVFLNGDNNLDRFGAEDVNEMERVGSTDQVAVVVQHDRAGSGGTKRFLVRKDSNASAITSPVLEDMPEQDMGSTATLKAFIDWGLEKYPAKKVCLIIWNHGAGWGKRSNVVTRGVSYDDDSGNHLTVPQVGEVLRDVAVRRGQKIDLLDYDACYMQMAECIAEVQDSVAYQVGSEETEPGKGNPYDDWLTDVVANPAWGPVEVGTSLVKRFKESYSGGSQGSGKITLSLVDVAVFAGLKDKIDAFTKAALADPANKAQLVAAARATQRYSDASFADLYDYVDQVTARVKTAEVAGAADAVRGALVTSAEGAQPLVIANAFTGTSLGRSHGLSVWLPSRLTEGSADLKRYRDQAWSQTTSWDELLTTMLVAPQAVLSSLADGASDVAALALAFRGPQNTALVRRALEREPSAGRRALLRAVQALQMAQ